MGPLRGHPRAFGAPLGMTTVVRLPPSAVRRPPSALRPPAPLVRRVRPLRGRRKLAKTIRRTRRQPFRQQPDSEPLPFRNPLDLDRDRVHRRLQAVQPPIVYARPPAGLHTRPLHPYHASGQSYPHERGNRCQDHRHNLRNIKTSPSIVSAPQLVVLALRTRARQVTPPGQRGVTPFPTTSSLYVRRPERQSPAAPPLAASRSEPPTRSSEASSRTG